MTLWLAYATTGREMDAQEQCEALGYTAIVPRKVEAIRRGKRRYAEAVISPYLPNYVFVEGAAEVFYAIKLIKEFRGTAMEIAPQSERRVREFIARIEADYTARMSQIEAGQRVSEYSPGDLLTLMTGPFAGQVAMFRRMVENAGDVFPKIEAELGVSLMGAPVIAVVDPINARRAG